MSNKRITGDYLRNQIAVMEMNLESLEKQKKKWSRFKNFVLGINLNIRIRKRQIKKRKANLERKLNEGWVE